MAFRLRFVQGMRKILIAVALTVTACTHTPPVQPSVNDAFVQQWTERIAGRENDPAGQVFTNIQVPWLKDVPARQFLLIMNGGYSRALGVTCTHCHVETDFASDEKRPKLAAREMAVMHRSINQQLAGMQHLAAPSGQRAINCSTCHRGEIDPTPAR